ncbi:MAG: hypothetical protein OXC83_07105 [Chloroflexi bacterium]|nr:hypothetical protein [Chloroflexota bacterium]
MKLAIIIAASVTAICSAACSSASPSPVGSITPIDGKSAPVDEPQDKSSTQPPPSPTLDQTSTIRTTSVDPSVSYLEATVEPCSPVEGSSIDPCERRDWSYNWVVQFQHPDLVKFTHVTGQGRKTPYYPPPTLREEMRLSFQPITGQKHRLGDDQIPHFFARGVFRPGSTRCALHESNLTFGSDGITTLSRELGCYADFEVREYLVGRGPELLTLHPPVFILHTPQDPDFYKTGERLGDLASHVGETWEGSEFVVVVGLNYNNAVEVWRVNGVGDVQRREDGEIIISWGFLHLYPPNKPFEPYLNMLEPRLDDYRTEVAPAYFAAAEEFDLNPVLDANLIFLRKYLEGFGIYDVDEVEIKPPPKK